MATMPRVSVLIPTHNRARHVALAIQSALAQEYQDMEVLVIDDGSTDETPAVLASFGTAIRVHASSHHSAGHARNLGLAHSHGELVAFLDSDDLWRADKLRKQVAALDTMPGVGLVGCRYQRIDAEGSPVPRTLVSVPPLPAGDAFLALATGRAAVQLSSLLFRRSLLRSGEGFRTDLRITDDTELILRLARRARFHAIPEELISYRVHPDQIMRQTATQDLIAEHEVIMREHFVAPYMTPRLQQRARAERMVRWSAWSAREGSFVAARCHLWSALRRCPPILLRPRWWFALALALIPELQRMRVISNAYANPARIEATSHVARTPPLRESTP